MGAQAVRLSNVDIDNALKNKDFEVLFQPIFDLGNGALARMETFVRWRHPSLGVLPPGAFISFFETQGRMGELTRYVLAEALNAYLDWRGPYAPGFSINLALSDLCDEAFASHFTKLLRDSEFPADLVTLECPMPTVDTDLKIAAANFNRLRETGARLAIEVRGRANELLRTIDPFPFDEIKTGGSAILRFARTVRGPGLSAISDLLDIANKANAIITAVGVEDQASLAALRGLGFTAAQGNHLAKVGDLKDFRPGRVNDVRELLDLETLDSESLSALFRTEAPAPQAATAKAEETVSTKDSNDALLERMNERLAQQEATPATEEIASDDDKKAKAREKAKALALAKRAKAREARKAAAIKRAKAKAAAASTPAGGEHEENPFPQSQAPRDLQNRLNEEFAAKDQPEAPKQNAAPKAEEPAAATKPTASEQTPPELEQKAPEHRPDESAITPQSADQTAPATTHPMEGMVAPMKQDEEKQQVLSLSVDNAGAHFRPGIRVGNPALRTTQPQQTPPEIKPDAQEAVEPPSLFDQPSPIQESAQPEPIAPETSEPAQEMIQGDLHEEYLEEDKLSAKSITEKHSKTFLQRTVVPYSALRLPQHFWPKSWNRQYRRVKAKLSAPQTTSPQASDAPAAE